MKTRNFLGLCFVSILFLSAACSGSTQEEETETLSNFLGLSDIHFNPFYDPSLTAELMRTPVSGWNTIFESSKVKNFGTYGWGGKFIDTGYPLFKSAIANMKVANPNPEFITINGDFLAHTFESLFQTNARTTDTLSLQDFTVKTLEFIVSSIEDAFPGTPIFPTLGNNDAFCGDYEIRTPGSFLTRTASIWERNLDGLINKADFNKTYQKGGYFVAESPINPKHKIISLNTVMLSVNYMKETSFCGAQTDSAANRASAEAQFTWFENELEKAKTNDELVWVMYHVPPGFNIYPMIKSNVGPPAVPCDSTIVDFFYQIDYNTRFLEIISKHKSVIAAQLGGHTHMDNFMVINGDTNPESFVHIQPSITPINWNNPGFMEYTYNSFDSELKDYNVHGFNNVETAKTPNWKKEYSFSEAYGQSEITTESLKAVYTNFLTDSVARERYIEYYVVEDSANVSIDKADWWYYYCALGNQTEQAYKDCICNKGK